MEQTREWIRRAKEGDKDAKEKLVKDNCGLVWNVVKGFAGRGYDREELFQIGCIGLIKSIDRFDFAYDVKFSTYAVPLITGEIRRFLRDDGMIKVSRRLKENGGKIHQAREKLMHQHGREPSMEEISRETNLSEEEILLSMEANVEVDSLNRTYESAGKEVSILEYIPAERDLEEELVEHLTLKQAMKILDSKEKILIRMRYYEDKTQTEAARHFGVSQVQISRMEKKILTKLRKSFE